MKKGIVFKKVVGEVHAVNDVSFSVRGGETVSLVGESGSGNHRRFGALRSAGAGR